MSQLAEFLSGRRLTGPARYEGPVFEGNGNAVNVQTFAAGGAMTALTINSPKFQKLTINAIAATLALPTASLSKGLSFNIVNLGGADLTVGTTVPVVLTGAVNEAIWVISDGTSWVHMGIYTVAAA